MSASEQEIKSQIAEMQQALRSALAGRRAARVVNIIGVILGFCIVGLIVYSTIWGLILPMASQPERLQKAIQQHLTTMQLDKKAVQAIETAAPAYLQEAQKMASDLKVLEKVQEQARQMIADLEPTFRAELENMKPRVIAMFNTQKEQTLSQLQDLLQKKIVDRVRDLLSQQGERLQAQTDLDEAGVEKILANLRDASTEAFTNMVRKRAGNLEKEITDCVAVVAQIPALPEAKQEKVLDDLMAVLAALVKEELPSYTFEKGELEGPAAPPGPAGEAKAVSPEVREKAAEAGKAQGEQARKRAAEEGTR